MNTIFLTPDVRLTDASAATVGFFDGVHVGHRFVVGELLRLSAGRGLQPLVVTFDRHPCAVLPGVSCPPLLSTLEEKVSLLGQTGVGSVVVVPFDERLSLLPARDFMHDVLQVQLGVRLLLTGYDNRFGHRRKDLCEGFDDYVRYGVEMGMEVKAAPLLQGDCEGVSSSRIRRLLHEGGVSEAAQCLGRCYVLGGRVVHGEQQGRKLGFPTANIVPDSEEKLVPGNGVYAVRVSIDGDDRQLTGMTNIGRRPTFDGHRKTIETHLFDFNDTLYGKHLRLSFVERLRDEQPFDSPRALALQMADDAAHARTVLDNNR